MSLKSKPSRPWRKVRSGGHHALCLGNRSVYGSEMTSMFNRRRLIQSSLSSVVMANAFAGSARAMISEGDKLKPGYVPDTQEMIEAPGGRIYVRSNGNVTGGKTPLVMIHGGPGSCHADLTPAVLHRGDRPIILYDQLDSGLSEAPGKEANWKVERFVDELGAVLDHFGAERYHILGHSWGGSILLEHALRNDPRSAGLIFQGALVSTQDWIDDTDVLRTRLPEETQQTLTECGTDFSSDECSAALDEFYANFLRRDDYTPAQKAYRAQIDNLWNQEIYEYMWGPTEFVSTGTLSDYDRSDDLGQLQDRDTLFSAAEYDEARPESYQKYAEAAGGEFAVVPNGAHAIFIDNPSEAMRIIEDWLTTIES